MRNPSGIPDFKSGSINSKPDPAPIEIGKGMLFGFVCSIPLWALVVKEFVVPILKNLRIFQ
jgi:hypothetical protein